MIDLWPDDIGISSELKAPIIILREQASLLGPKTQNLVEGMVVQRPTRELTSDFEYDFFLVARALRYRYMLFAVEHTIDQYPVTIRPQPSIMDEIRKPDQESSEIKVESEDEFLEVLRRIFHTNSVRGVVQGILAQFGKESEELVIHSAQYGAGSEIYDVTDLLRSIVSRSGTLKMTVSNDALGGDPIRGVVKELEVVYSYAGQRHSITKREGEGLSLP